MRATVAGRKSIAFRRGSAATVLDSDAGTAAAPMRKGYFVVYSSDGQRFEVPLMYIKSDIFGELFRMSEDVFGLQGAGPIILPCDVAMLSSVLSCLRMRSSRDAERALLASMASHPCSTLLAPCSSLIEMNQRLVVCSC